jgi:LCP family protein required for cell wall assembly
VTDERDEFEEHEEHPLEGEDQVDETPPAAPEPGEYVEPPTEELFAFEARVEEGDGPELDPIFRAALLESAESAISNEGSTPDPADAAPPAAEAPAAEPPAGEPPAVEPPTGTDEAAIPSTGDFEATGEYPLTGEEPATGTQEWEAPDETGITSEQTAVLQAAARSEVHDAIEFSRRTGRAWDPPRPPARGDFDQPAKRPRYWWRFLLATLLIIGSFATATQASVMHIVDDIAHRIGDKPGGPKLPPGLLTADDGPQTIAIIGSDVRTGGGDTEGDPGRSDTTLLVRLDPDTEQIAMLSIPRDLYTDIPGYGYDKFNAAYSYGGTKLTLQTLKSLTGLDINHVVNVDFQGFADVIDAIGCVYIDVDRHYFNDNAGLSVAEQYATIDIEAGYQKLCGADALEFARYRHTDSDLVRAARQQDLIGEVRNRLSFGEVLKRRDELLDAFADNTTSDISSADDIFSLLKLLLDSRSAAVTEVSFPSTFTMRDGVSYVEATPDQIDAAVNKFLGFKDQPGPVGTLDQGDGAKHEAQSNSEKAREKRAARERKKALEETTSHVPGKNDDELVDDASAGLSVAQDLDGQITRNDFPVYYPKRLPSGAIYADGQSRVYHTRDPDKNVFGAYRMVMEVLFDDGTHYFGLQGLRGWTDPPILDAPHDEVEMDDRKFQVYPEGDRIKLVSWTDGENVYWIANSLLLGLTNDQMLGMARSSRAFTPDK